MERTDYKKGLLPWDINDVIKTPLPPVQNSEWGYIATCMYGSYDCPQVWTLRRFRDYTLKRTWYGRIFIKFYYKTSPKLVKLFGQTKWFKHFWKHQLDKIVAGLNYKGVDNTCYYDK